jgi:predicted dehydrogenase
MRLEKAAAAIASHSLEKAQEKAKEWNIPRSYGSYEALLEDEDINVVYVAMINSQHYK